ncbi:MAG: copper amine oxidase N-terminal domain-containing protein [Acetobacteraceae bacterium]|nr:copper amine oxidase N-terminal domain-containing protein [Acetobacteraceae bacterium]
MRRVRLFLWLALAAVLAACLRGPSVRAATFSVRIEPFNPAYAVTQRLGGSIGPNDPVGRWVIDVTAEVMSLDIKVSTRSWDSIRLLVLSDGRVVAQRSVDLRNSYGTTLRFPQETWHRVEIVTDNSGNWMDAWVDVTAVVRETRKLVGYPEGIQPRRAALGSTQQIRVKVSNVGTLAVDHLWLGVDVCTAEGVVVEVTRTPVRLEGGIDFGRQQYRGLAPGESRVFSAPYTFKVSSAPYSHVYRAGTYLLKYRAWEGVPGVGTPLTPVQTGILELLPAPAPTPPQPPAEPGREEVVLWVGRTQAWVDGQPRVLDVAPRVVQGRTLVPVRFVAESLGAAVSWDPATQTARLVGGGHEVALTVGCIEARLDGAPHRLEVAPMIVSGRMLVPVRVVAEALDVAVSWSAGEGRVTLKLP